MKNPVPSLVIAKINPPIPAPKNVVYKKTSRDKSVTYSLSQIAIYLGKRDFVDHVTHADPVDGVLVLDTGYIKSKKGRQFSFIHKALLK
uniref:Uncharacterized protein n=1 Tax=Callorhinchus milii TaxID=7868 RepID=A0A4W3HYI5_CALMI